MRKQSSRWHRAPVIAGIALISTVGLGVAVNAGAEEPRKSQPEPAANPPATAPRKNENSVRITLQTIPPRQALVKWGKKTLGMVPAPKPLIVMRPRDSGPLDLVFRATGYLPVHTRAYTFSDSRVAVKLTPVEEKNTLFGYREETPAPGASNPDGGVAPPVEAKAPLPHTVGASPTQGPPVPGR